MDDEGSNDERWTCDACGCNTNPRSSNSCGICGTSVSLLRRAAGRAWFSSRLPDELELLETGSPSIISNIEHPERVLEQARTKKYHPYWQKTTAIEIGTTEESRHLAHVPNRSGGEGKTVRSALPLPDTSSGPVGFQVAFDQNSSTANSNSSTSSSLGGCYLIGVVTAAFNDFNSFKGLQTSEHCFWGIEDSGHLYEGILRGRRRETLFGPLQVITVVLFNSTLSFWKDGSFLGTLVGTVPTSGPLYPVVVPFNSGVTVALTGLQASKPPLELLHTYRSEWEKLQNDREQIVKEQVAERRRLLVHSDDNELLDSTRIAVSDICKSYSHKERLWYQCGWRLSKYPNDELDATSLCEMLQTFVQEDLKTDYHAELQVGDIVQLVEGFEKFSDASGGPLLEGDRGVVVDLQKGPNGEQRSVRVLHNNRRWWYQQAAICTVNSGLIDSNGIWMLQSILTSHGYDEQAQLRVNSKLSNHWKAGDIVSPISNPNVYGRIVSTSSSNRSELCTVEYVDVAFADALGIRRPMETSKLESFRVAISKLVFGRLDASKASGDDASSKEQSTTQDETLLLSEKIKAHVAAIANLDTSSMDNLVKECRKSSDILATLFAAGLPEQLLAALKTATAQLNRLEPPEDLSQKLASYSALVNCIAEQLFGGHTMRRPTTPDSAAIRRTTRPPVDRRTRDSFRESLQSLRALAPPSRRNRDADEDENMDLESLRFVNSLQQRRSMLLSLMSRRRGGSSAAGAFLNNLANAEEALGPLRGVPPYVFGPDLGEDDDQQNNNWDTEPRPSELEQQHSQSNNTYLDSLLRCRGDAATAQANLKQGGGAAYSTFVRHLIHHGILVDSLEWVEGLVQSHLKKVQVDKFSLLRNAVDEEGTPVLLLAISFGCSFAMIHKLIGWGAPVTKQEIQLAARRNHARILSLLLQHASLSEMDIDAESCTPEIRSVLEKTKSRQSTLEAQMRSSTADFMVRLLRELWKLALSSRRTVTARTQACSKVVCEILVGSVLLLAVQQSQKSGRPPMLNRDVSGRSGGGFPTDSDTDFVQKGLLRLIPRDMVCYCLTGDGYLTSFLLLCEDYLCSKDMNDVAAGLTLLSTVLSYFPELRKSPELDRFGMKEFVSNHNTLASDRIAEILTKQLVNLDMGGDGEEKSDASTKNRRIVKCPKNHVAELHITRHSSFRCDICATGVERGRPMHGCRQCDWDACEDCTDKSESGLVKYTALRELANDCLKLLSDETCAEAPDDKGAAFLQVVSDDAVDELKDIAKRLFSRDVHALNDLGLLLNEPGRVSVQQFMQHVLPSLHASLVRQSSPSDGADSGHRKKKARVIDGSNDYASDSFDTRLDFCHESLLRMMPTNDSKVSAFSGFESTAATKKSNEGSSRPASPTNSEGKIDISYSANASEILRRLHQVLSFYENVKVTSSLPPKKSISGGSPKSDLHSLTQPIEIHLLPIDLAEVSNVSPQFRSVVQTEPLVPFEELRRHVLRTYRVVDPHYVEFCRRLGAEHAVLMERSLQDDKSPWKIARIESFDEATGAHKVRYASSWKRGQNRDILQLGEKSGRDLSLFRFSGPESCLILAARKYYILFRTPAKESSSHQSSAARDVAMLPSSESESNKIARAIGSRVESSCSGNWQVYTVVAAESLGGPEDYSFDLVSEDGELHRNIRSDLIRTQLSLPEEESSRRRLSRSVREDRSSGLFPFFAVARRTSEYMREESSDSYSGSSRPKGILKRSWSALSLIDEMRPVDLSISSDANLSLSGLSSKVSFKCSLDGDCFDLTAETSWLEAPPHLSVFFGVHEKIAGTQVSSPSETTIVRALNELHQGNNDWLQRPNCVVYFSVKSTSGERPHGEFVLGQLPSMTQVTVDTTSAIDYALSQGVETRTRKLSSRSIDSDGSNDSGPVGLCDGLDKVCVQCMEVIGVFSQCADDSSHKIADSPDLPGFANPVLSKKLAAQLDDPLCVVGGALPDWCRFGPSFCPKVFSYESRRSLLERAAFGVSRSTLKQQEAHVNVGKLRHRMAALRSRAVELVGEAFSGGAEDPTALQLQADELYGMEEALASKVRSAFRAVKWQEHSLEVAKVAVRRDNLLDDAAAVMHKYATDKSVCRRRLEVRFEGESGFDAASGDEAGVTRGFYADVAEALLSVDKVAGVYCASPCSKMAAAASLTSIQPMDTDELEKESAKLPLWIPDLDSSGQVVIPTPRADKRSALGVFPRPLPRYHPQYDEVLQQFRFMGRLFAAAMRDGFMFPLPLSAAFLKLVQMCGAEQDNESDGFVEPHACTLLQTSDLPRPGFLGGEVYAADQFVCRALDELDASNPALSRHELKRRYEDIATDTNFARSALGKNYECSFEEYFQDRTFVDPLDPTQSDGAPLCPNGSKKPVTVFNVREWVVMAKNFILHDGVIGQATAFRQGVEDFFSVDHSLHLFAAEELQRDVCGIGDDVDKWNEAKIRKLFKLDGGKGAAEALVAVAAIGGEGGAALSRRFGPSSPTIGFLVKALLEGTPKHRRQFLSFVTSVPIVTPGRIEVVPILSPSGEFLPMQDPGCLPRANTCARRLYLPKFESFDTFSTVLWAVVKAESSFKGFYEWRGSH